ncbi:UNVERIFIED_CONTAM: protein FAR-RED IMPAIRED RESPONSE 1 [Sesamum latifolium]|uniref:Protein FAR-RED IMPAIRED RESPONSE 1 n=1 Tax=Sesamum latifolium TaxID=2727402 RepID=A0AAW2VGJ2_9LAMI
MHKVYRAKRYAIERIKGNIKQQYERLYDYCATVEKHNPRSTLVLKVDRSLSPPLLQRMYYCLSGLRAGFLDGCRPIIGLDGCFLKGMYKGQLLTAIGRDGNDNIFPIAMAYVEIEKFDSWEWFLNLLLRDIGSHEQRGWAFISDRQKGLLEAVSNLAPNAEHRFCLRHMYNNFKGKFKGVELKKLFWEQPIIDMFESIRRKLMSRIQVKREGMEKYDGVLVGYPCYHAIAAISYHRLNLEDYVDDYFKKEAYLRVYRHMINPVPGMHDYEESSLGIVNPPHVATKVGRPKKVRRRDANDLKDGNVVSRKGLSHTCANCLKTGHNKRSCTNPTHPNSRKTQVTVGDSSETRNEPQHTQTEEVSQFSENIASTYESWFSQPLHSEMPLNQSQTDSSHNVEILPQALVNSMSARPVCRGPSSSIPRHPKRPIFTQPPSSAHRPQQSAILQKLRRPPSSSQSQVTSQFKSPFQIPPPQKTPIVQSHFNSTEQVHKDNVPQPHRAPVAQPHANSTEQVLVDNMSAPVKSPRKRKQQHPISKTSKVQKNAEGSTTLTNFQRKCCSSTKPTLQSQLRSISGSYKPRPSAESSSSKTQHASVHKG